MDLKYVQGELQKLSEIIDGWNTTQQVDALERDLALEKLRALYEVVRFGSVAEPAAADVADAEPFADGMPVSIDLGEVLSIEPLPVSDAVGEPFAAAKTGFQAESVEQEETAESEPAAEPEFASAEPDVPAAEAAAIFPASGAAAMDETGSMPGTSPVTKSEPDDNAAEPFAGHADAPAPVVADAAEPVRKDAPVEQPVGESESEMSGAAAAFEPIPVSEPTLEPTSALKPASEPAPEPASKPVPDTIPAPDTAPAAEQPAPVRQPIAPTLFGPEEETVRHRHKQRVIMSLYNNEPSPERPAPGKPASSERAVAGSSVAEPLPEASPSRHSAPSGQPAPIAAEPEPILDAVAVPAAADDDLTAVMEVPARPVEQPAEPVAAEDADEPDFEEITLEKASEKIPASNGAAVLGDVINHDVQTLADTIAPPRDVASELRRSEHVTDLRRAIGINDKFLMIRDLFGGDAAAYEAAIDKLNAFDDFDECMIHIAENYAWNANSDGAKFLMELLERKFA